MLDLFLKSWRLEDKVKGQLLSYKWLLRHSCSVMRLTGDTSQVLWQAWTKCTQSCLIQGFYTQLSLDVYPKPFLSCSELTELRKSTSKDLRSPDLQVHLSSIKKKNKNQATKLWFSCWKQMVNFRTVSWLAFFHICKQGSLTDKIRIIPCCSVGNEKKNQQNQIW